MISIDEFKKVEIRVGKVVTVERVEESKKLLKLMVDFNEEKPRQVISGIAKFITPEELLGITCAFVTNLEPREIMGLKSEAMIMAISTDTAFSLLRVSENIPLGSIAK